MEAEKLSNRKALKWRNRRTETGRKDENRATEKETKKRKRKEEK